MEYVYGHAVIDGAGHENLKTVGDGPLLREGEYFTSVRQYADSTITDRCRIRRHYKSAVGLDGTKYEFYLIEDHYRYVDKSKKAQAAIRDADAMNVDQEYRLTLLELGITDFEV